MEDGRPEPRYSCPITFRVEIGQRGKDLGPLYIYGQEKEVECHSCSFQPKSCLRELRHTTCQLLVDERPKGMRPAATKGDKVKRSMARDSWLLTCYLDAGEKEGQRPL